MLDNDSACKTIIDEHRAILLGHQGKMGKLSTLLALNIALVICEPIERLARAFPNIDYTTTGTQQSRRAL